jgi:hypothetical protein
VDRSSGESDDSEGGKHERAKVPMSAAPQPGGFFDHGAAKAVLPATRTLFKVESRRAEGNACAREACDAALGVVVYFWKLRCCEWLAREWSGES